MIQEENEKLTPVEIKGKGKDLLNKREENQENQHGQGQGYKKKPHIQNGYNNGNGYHPRNYNRNYNNNHKRNSQYSHDYNNGYGGGNGQYGTHGGYHQHQQHHMSSQHTPQQYKEYMANGTGIRALLSPSVTPELEESVYATALPPRRINNSSGPSTAPNSHWTALDSPDSLGVLTMSNKAFYSSTTQRGAFGSYPSYYARPYDYYGGGGDKNGYPIFFPPNSPIFPPGGLEVDKNVDLFAVGDWEEKKHGQVEEDYCSVQCESPAPANTTNPKKSRYINDNGMVLTTNIPSCNLLSEIGLKSQHSYPHYQNHHRKTNFSKLWQMDINPDALVDEFKFGEMKVRPSTFISEASDYDSVRTHYRIHAKDPEQITDRMLSEQIWRKFLTNQQTTDTFKKKMELWKEIFEAIKPKHKPYSKYGLQVVGSTMSGFGSNTSDVDMCLLVGKFEVDQRCEAVAILHEIHELLRINSQMGESAEIIYAKVPILKLKDLKRGLEVDLNCNNFVGIRNTQLLYCYSQLDWRVKPLVLVIKLWAQTQAINDAKNMTISSYSLVLMVIHFLQLGTDPVLPCLHSLYPDKFSNTTDVLKIKINENIPPWESSNKESLGQLLVRFLDYYSRKFDFSHQAVSVRIGCTIAVKLCMQAKSYKNDPHQWKHICIEEPFDLTNTARSVYDKDAFEKIRGIFITSLNKLEESKDLDSIFFPISHMEALTTANLHKIRY